MRTLDEFSGMSGAAQERKVGQTEVAPQI
jgi:hypothetical protein